MPSKPRRARGPSIKDDPFYLRPGDVSSGPKKRSRSIVYQPARELTETEYWHNDLFWGPAYHTPRYTVANGDVTPRRLLGKQVTVSEGHPTKKLKASGPDLGGDFFTTRQYIEGLHGRNVNVFVEQKYFGWIGQDVERWYYSGPVYPILLRGPNGSYNTFPDSIHSSKEVMMEKGATAVARCKPTNSVADVATFLGELRSDGLPHLPMLHSLKEKSLKGKSLGNEFLNYEFGWQPLMSDLKSFYKAVHTAGDVIKQFRRDNGKVVRRQYTFPIEKTVDVLKGEDIDPQNWYTIPEWFSGPATFYESAPSRSTLTRETVRRMWFSGAFTYHIPVGDDKLDWLMRTSLEAQHLGTPLPTPETIWNVAPWSWAIDWFTNTGDVISNINDRIFDGLVLRYGYLMEHTIVKDTYTCDPLHLIGGERVPILPLTFVTETKQRVKANPFGFGVTWDGLSPLQVAIAAALGITRR